MKFLLLGFMTGLSLILAIGAQNIFVIEQGIKRQFIFLVCLVCAVSDLILIFFGIFLFEYLAFYFNTFIEFIFNILLLIFLSHFIFSKIIEKKTLVTLNKSYKTTSIQNIILKTLGFTYLNPHVYSDTVFFLGNFSKNFIFFDKILFGIGASLASFLFFFSLGYASNYFSKFLNNAKIWIIINWIIILIMGLITLYVLKDIINYI